MPRADSDMAIAATWSRPLLANDTTQSSMWPWDVTSGRWLVERHKSNKWTSNANFPRKFFSEKTLRCEGICHLQGWADVSKCVRMCQFRNGRKKCVKMCLFRIRCVKMCQWYIEMHFISTFFYLIALLCLGYLTFVPYTACTCHAMYMYSCDGEIMLTCGVCGCIRVYSAVPRHQFFFVFPGRPRLCTPPKP